MTSETAHKYMENEIRCIQRESTGVCTKDCIVCEFDRDDNLLIEVYGMSVLALEKQIPKKAKITHDKSLLNIGWRFICPLCGIPVGINVYNPKFTMKEHYCMNCGQRINWNDWR